MSWPWSHAFCTTGDVHKWKHWRITFSSHSLSMRCVGGSICSSSWCWLRHSRMSLILCLGQGVGAHRVGLVASGRETSAVACLHLVLEGAVMSAVPHQQLTMPCCLEGICSAALTASAGRQRSDAAMMLTVRTYRRYAGW